MRSAGIHPQQQEKKGERRKPALNKKQTWRWGWSDQKEKRRGIEGEGRRENTLGQYYKLI